MSEKARRGTERALAAVSEACVQVESRVGNGITDVSVTQIVVEDMLECEGSWLGWGGGS